MANAKISALSDAAALTGAEQLLLSQSAADKKQTLATARAQLDWIRPTDWPAMPATAANTVRLMVAVSQNGHNAVSIRFTTSTGNYNVDWGDGTTSMGVASNTTADKTYDYSDVDLPAATSRGYKVAIITVTPATGNLTGMPSVAVSGLNAAIPQLFLEAQINASSMTSFSFGGNQASRHLEYVNVVATGTITSGFADMFFNCTRLERVDVPSGWFAGATSFSRIFSGCTRLRRIDLSSLGGDLTTISQAFSGCASLETLVFPSGSLDASLTAMDSAFLNCTRLRSITFPSGSMSAVTTMSATFQNCTSLEALTIPSGAWASASLATFANCFNGCASLRYFEFPSGSLGNVTNAASLFSGCLNLTHVKFPTGTLFSGMASNPPSFPGNIGRIENCAIPISFSVANARLTAAALDEIYTALPSVSATITVSSNPGTTGDTPSIATGKGWTVTGS